MMKAIPMLKIRIISVFFAAGALSACSSGSLIQEVEPSTYSADICEECPEGLATTKIRQALEQHEQDKRDREELKRLLEEQRAQQQQAAVYHPPQPYYNTQPQPLYSLPAPQPAIGANGSLY